MEPSPHSASKPNANAVGVLFGDGHGTFGPPTATIAPATGCR